MAPPARADGAYSIGVDVAFAAKDLTDGWSDAQLKGVIGAFRTIAAQRFNQKFRHWSFVEGTGQRVGLDLRVVEVRETGDIDILYEIHGLEVPQKQRSGSVHWRRLVDLFNTGGIRPDRAGGELADRLDTLLTDNEEPIGALLRQFVPIADSDGKWRDNRSSGTLEFVLPLRWDQYESLQSSTFRVACTVPHAGPADVMVSGRGRSAPYRAAGGVPYAAIVARPMQSVAVGDTPVTVTPARWAEVMKLEPHQVFLSQFVPLSPFRTP